MSDEESGVLYRRFRLSAGSRTTVVIALAVTLVAGFGGFYFARGHTASIPNHWVARTPTNVYLLKWTRAGSQITGSLEDDFSMCGTSLATSTYDVSGVIANGSVTLRIDEGDGVIDTVDGSASPTRLTFAEMRYFPGGEKSFDRLARSLSTSTSNILGQPCAGERK